MMNEVFKRFTVKRKPKYEKEQEDIEIEFTQRKKEIPNEDDKPFIISAVVAATVLEKEWERTVVQTIFPINLGGLKDTSSRMMMNSRKG